MSRWWSLLVVALVACGGDDGTSDSSAGDDDDTQPLECELPNYDLTTMSCEQLAGAWRDTVSAGNYCNEASECVALRAPCESWYQVGCYHATNAACVDAEDLAAFSAEAAGCTTTGDSCICSGSAGADCINHVCTIVSSTQ
jgi:hypothetical protein